MSLLLAGCQQEGTIHERVPEPEIVPDGVYINELMARNTSTITDESGSHSDWIELHNSADAPASLAGLYLSDNYDELAPDQYALPPLEIPAGGFLVLWADGDAKPGDAHLSFTLDDAGEDVMLYMLDAQGGWILVDGATFKTLGSDLSYGREIDGGADWITFSEPSPGDTNW